VFRNFVSQIVKVLPLPNKLLHQLLMTYLAIVSLSLVGIGGFTLFALKTSSLNDLTYYLSLEAHNISSFLVEKDLKFLENLAQDLSSHGFWVTLLDKKGDVLYSSIEEENLQLGNRSLRYTEAIQDALRGKTRVYRFYSRRTQINWYLVAVPHLNKEGDIIGVVRIGLPLASLNEELGNSFYTLLCLGVLISVITIFVIWALANWIANPIKLISSQARQISDTGELKIELPISRFDEIGELAKSFNMMIYKLRQEKNFQKEFIANASHELKTPVTAISSALEILEHGHFKNESEKKYFFDILNRQTNRLKELITDLLDISVLDSGRVDLHLSSFMLVPFIEECVKDIDPLVQRADVDFSWYVESNLELIADKAKLHRALINLLTNAIKHTPAKGEVLLTVSTKKLPNQYTELTFSIQDSGSGIPKDEQDKIFGRFYRSQQDRSRETGGSGLGLAIVKQIVDLHGGTLTLNSEEGMGAEFRIQLKVFSAKDSPTAAEQSLV
jgi:signal transduction histidine kinase